MGGAPYWVKIGGWADIRGISIAFRQSTQVSYPYTGSRLGAGPIFEVSVSHLDVKERPGKLPMLSS